jgi:hypothetical protein
VTSTLLSFHNLISPSGFASFSPSLFARPFADLIDMSQQTKSVKMTVSGEMTAVDYTRVSVETHGSFILGDCHVTPCPLVLIVPFILLPSTLTALSSPALLLVFMSGYTSPCWPCSKISSTLHQHRSPHLVRDFEIKQVPVPSVGLEDVLLKGKYSLANLVGLRPTSQGRMQSSPVVSAVPM